MLTELRIRNLGVIDDALMTCAPGLTVVTGETGAGKTMIVSGLGLVAGARADPALIRTGTARAVVEARFAGVPDAVAERARELGAELDDDELLLARHLVGARSRAFVGGVQVPASTAADLAGDLVTLHGQSEQVRLGTPERQREVLDRAAGPGLTTVLDRYREAWARRHAAGAELAVLRASAQARARQLDLLQFGLGEVAKVDPQPGEDIALAAEAHRLEAADDLRVTARAALVALAGDDEGVDNAPGALGMLTAARKGLAQAGERDPALGGYATRLQEAGYVVADVAADLASYLADLDADPGRLEQIAERRAALQHLTRKYGDTVDDVVAWASAAAVELATLGESDDRITELATEVGALDTALTADAGRLTGLREDAAARLRRDVVRELKALAMPHARLEFALSPLAELGPFGAELVQLLFSANPGSEPAPLGRVASGGELSRVRLALEVVLATDAQGQTFVFDEVDAGVGGQVAIEIGRRLAALAGHAQVLVVTHLAQVAAFADAHWVVTQADDGQVTTSGVAEVSGPAREAELARMMGGESTPNALAHARELLAQAAG